MRGHWNTLNQREKDKWICRSNRQRIKEAELAISRSIMNILSPDKLEEKLDSI
jgi:hypothetical protein